MLNSPGALTAQAGNPATPPSGSSAAANQGEVPDSFSGLKEGVTSFLALSIACISLYMLVSTFHHAADPDAKSFAAYKDILLYGLSLFGTVLGYYFGRVPAELHAQQATAAANAAQGQLKQAQDTTANALAGQQQLKQNVREVLTAVKQNLLSASAPPVATVRAVPQANGLQQSLAEIDEALKRI
jgi:hypothetical protein